MRPLVDLYFVSIEGISVGFLRKKSQRAVVLRVSVSRAEMMRVWMAENKEAVSSGYANCMFAGRLRTLILMLGRLTHTLAGREDATRFFGFVYTVPVICHSVTVL